jgi:lipoprotein-anchoring transpeptidase ErfK/SrfK
VEAGSLRECPRSLRAAGVIVGIVVGAALVVFASAPVAGAREPARSPLSVDVVGSGPIAWPRVAVRTAPTRAARVITTLTQFRSDFRPRTLLAVRARGDGKGKPTWYQVAIPGRPNGRRGWVPAGSVTLKPVDRWLVIFRSERRFSFVLRGRVVRSGPVAIGAPGMETPLGMFFVQAMFRPTATPILGAYAFETSGYSKLSDWPGGGVVGVHGTDTPELIGQAVSHGCVRLRNEDAMFLRTVVRVGTPVKIVA